MTKSAIKSMTAYGRSILSTDAGRWVVEIQTLNRRHFELSLSLPRSLTRFEMDLRKKIASRIGRGQVNVTVIWQREGKGAVRVLPDLSRARAVKKAWDDIASDCGLEPCTLGVLALEKELLRYEEEVDDELLISEILEKTLGEALDRCVAMREQEGRELAKDLARRADSLGKEVDEIEKISPEVVDLCRQKLTKRVEELFSGNSENEERILREIAIFAERVDITEETVRFRSHLKEFKAMLTRPLQTANETRGKGLDFILQELMREINTMGSKASDINIAHLVVRAKSELEKMREQIQNIE